MSGPKVEWEKGALQELYREYRATLLLQKVDLRPAAIAFCDSQTHWGRWDALTRTISISRRLIETRPWFDVVGVLRHEMAHQFVDEMLVSNGFAGHRPHGEVFRQACDRLGVPEQYARASAELQSSTLDWREEPRDSETEKLLEKARKLLALATSSNEHESILAMNKVRELYARHNLEQAELEARASFAHLVISHGKLRIETYQSMIIGILVGHFFVRVIVSNLYDAKVGARQRVIELIGTRENVLMAEYVYHFLLRQSELLVIEAQKSRGRRFSGRERKSYRLGILRGFSNRLSQPGGAEKKVRGELPVIAATVEKALALCKNDRLLEGYIGRVYPLLRTRRTSATTVDSEAFSSGVNEGRKLTLKRPIEQAQGNRGGLLT